MRIAEGANDQCGMIKADSDNEGEEMYDDMLTTDQMIQMLEEEDSDE